MATIYMGMRSWKFRIYPSKQQENRLDSHLVSCKNLWNGLLEYSKKHYEETGKFPTRKQLYLKTKKTLVFSQVAQNVADRLFKSIRGMMLKKKAGKIAGFPRFKPIERMKSFTYPQFGFKLDRKLGLSGIGAIPIKKHREVLGAIKTLTIKKMPSGKWFAIFTSDMEMRQVPQKDIFPVGIDLGIEHFAYMSDGKTIENPRHFKHAEEKLADAQRRLSRKKKGGKNRRKARLKAAVRFEKLTNRRRDFLHKLSRKLVEKYSLIAMEDLNTAKMAKGFLAKSILDCGWAEFSGMLRYKAEEAGCEVVLVNPANTTSECSSCGSVQKKSLAERWHKCACGASMHRDLNAARNILNRATAGTVGRKACREETSTSYKDNGASVFHEAGSPCLLGMSGSQRGKPESGGGELRTRNGEAGA
jgi:putative transposase